MRKLCLIVLILAVGACAQAPRPPIPACDERQTKETVPVDGGLGGTGHRPGRGC